MNYKSQNDDVLLAYLRLGNEAAFREIYLRYWKKLFEIALRKVQSSKVAEELIQDIFLKLWASREDCKIDKLEYYLNASVKNGVINYFRASLTHEKFVDYADAQYLKHDSTTEQQIELNDLMATIEEKLESMPEKTRQIFRLNRLQSLPVKEISAKLNIPVRTVEYHLNQAVCSLKLHLKDYLSPSL